MSSIKWVVVAMILLLLCNVVLIVAPQYGLFGHGRMDLPMGAHDVVELGNGWHTFHLMINGKDRLFLHRLFPNSNSTECVSEIANSTEVVPSNQGKH